MEEDTRRIVSRIHIDLCSGFKLKAQSEGINTHSVVAEETGVGVVTDAGLRNKEYYRQ